MKSILVPLGACLLIATSAGLRADTIRLKNGTQLEGKILSETPENVTIETGTSIKEVHEVPRTTISAVDKQTPDEAVYEKLKQILPTDDLLDAADYKDLLEGELGTFEIRYKDSKHLNDVKEIITNLKDERAKVEDGGIKVGGKWITGKQAAADTYNHRARLENARLNISIEESDYARALRHFDTIEKDHRYSVVFKDALQAATGILPKYDAILQRMQLENASLMKTRDENLRSMDADRREKTEEAFQKQMGAFHASRASDAAEGRTWLAVSKYDAPSIDEARATVAAETERLAALDLSKQTAAANMVATVYAKLAANDLEGAASSMAAAAASGASGPLLDPLREKIEADVASAETERVAAAEAEEARKMAEIAAKPAVEDEDEDADKKKTPRELRQERVEAKRKANEEAKKAAGGGSADPGDDAGATAKAEEKGGMPFSTLIIILAGALALITVVAKVFMKPADDGSGE